MRRKRKQVSLLDFPRVNNREIWQIPLEEFKVMRGYRSFWMFRDYSPSQWAGMSKRTQRQIGRQHKEEARKNEKILEEHQRAVLRAHSRGKIVPPSILGRYEGVIRRKQMLREANIQRESREMEQYMKARRMRKMDFGKWFQKKELKRSPQLKNFDHVLRQQAYRYWKATHGITRGVPRYVLEEVGIMERRAKGE